MLGYQILIFQIDPLTSYHYTSIESSIRVRIFVLWKKKKKIYLVENTLTISVLYSFNCTKWENIIFYKLFIYLIICILYLYV